MLSRKMSGILYVLLLVSGIVAMDPVADSLKISLFTNPCSVLDEIYSVRKAFATEASNEGLDKEKNIATLITGLNSIASKYEKKNPIFLLEECTSDCCILSRCVNPLYRNIFENRVSKKLAESIVARKNTAPVTYTSFGCGGAFMDFVILSKVLCTKPDANLNVHLIDMKHQCYMKTADYFKISREITQNSQLFDHNSQEFNDFIVYAKDVGECKESHEEIKLAIINQSLYIYTQYHQLITWFKQTFPKANMRLFVHSETDEYLKYLDDHNIPHADVVTAADIQDDISRCFKAGLNYAKLCLKSLEKNPLCTNIWLAHNYQNGEICTISSQRPNTTMKIEEINEDDMVAYVAVENL